MLYDRIIVNAVRNVFLWFFGKMSTDSKKSQMNCIITIYLAAFELHIFNGKWFFACAIAQQMIPGRLMALPTEKSQSNTRNRLRKPNTQIIMLY